MGKTYQPIVIELRDLLIDDITEIGFFEENNITSLDYTKEVLSNSLTEKFIQGELDNEDGIFTEEEFSDILLRIETKNRLDSLVKKGLINFYSEDENSSNDLFFLTEKGREVTKLLIDDKEK